MKITTTILALAMPVCSLFGATQREQNTNYEQRYQPPQRQVQQQPTEPLIYQYRPENTSWQLSAYGEALFWTVSENLGEWALKGRQKDGNPSGNLQFRDYSSHLGYRIGVSGDFDERYWGIDVNFTSYSAKDSSRIYEPNSGTELVGLGETGTGDAPLVFWNRTALDYKLLNFLMKRQTLLGETVLLSFYTGPTMMWVNENTLSTYQGGTRKTYSQDKWNYNAVGLRIGLESEWYLYYGFSGLANLSVGGFYGKYQYYELMQLTEDTVPGTAFNCQEKRTAYDIQLALGPAWGMKWGDCAIKAWGVYNINLIEGIFKAYEFQQSPAANDGKWIFPFNGLLGLEGFSVGASIVF